MAGSASDYLEKKLLDHVLGNTAYAAPATVYVGLHTDANTATQRDAGTVTEVSGGSYARVAVTNNTTNWPNASGITAAKSNANAVTFPAPTANWGTVTSFGIYDAASAGNLLFWGDLSASRSILSGDGAPSFAAGDIDLTGD